MIYGAATKQQKVKAKVILSHTCMKIQAAIHRCWTVSILTP